MFLSPKSSKIRGQKIGHCQSNANYDEGNQIIYNTQILKSKLCDCNDAYILVRGKITVLLSSCHSSSI